MSARMTLAVALDTLLRLARRSCPSSRRGLVLVEEGSVHRAAWPDKL